MNDFDYSAIGQRVKALRKKKKLSQQELAKIISKSLRTVQKYETGEIEVSIAVVNQLAKVLDSTPTYIMGYEVDRTPIKKLADIMSLLFRMDDVAGLNFVVDTKRPPRNPKWECSISFDGKSEAEFNTDICLFLEEWQSQREHYAEGKISSEKYRKWQEETLAYYAATSVKTEE